MFHDIFTSLLDELLYERILEQSLESHQAELFNKTNDFVLEIDTKIYESDQKINCFICYNDICKGERVYELDCQHFYHDQCLLEAVSHQHTLCPVCRKSLPVRQIKIEKKTDSAGEHSITYHET